MLLQLIFTLSRIEFQVPGSPLDVNTNMGYIPYTDSSEQGYISIILYDYEARATLMHRSILTINLGIVIIFILECS